MSLPTTSVSPAIDPALLCLPAAAERGEATPSICLLTGSWLVQGQPARSQDFVSSTAGSWWQELAETKDARKFRGTEAEKEAAMGEVLDPQITAIAEWQPNDAPVLTLLGGMIGGGLGATFEMPTLRVPLSSVEAWWVTGFKVNQPGGSGGGMGFGMSF